MMKNKKRVKQLSVLVGIVIVSTFVLFAVALTSSEAFASGQDAAVLAGGCVLLTICAPIYCLASIAACICDGCLYCATCGVCDGTCLNCLQDCTTC